MSNALQNPSQRDDSGAVAARKNLGEAYASEGGSDGSVLETASLSRGAQATRDPELFCRSPVRSRATPRDAVRISVLISEGGLSS
jgi:hypothetical protein